MQNKKTKGRKNMDYSKVTLDELKKGYRYNKDNNAYICNYCEQHFEVGQIFSIGNNLYTAEHAISKHIQMLRVRDPVNRAPAFRKAKAGHLLRLP